MLREYATRVNLIVGTGFDGWCDFPDGGYLIYPYAVLKDFGSESQTISALWHMGSPEMPRPTWTPAPLAQVGCVPAKTLKRHLTTLVAAGIVEKSQSGRRTEYRLRPPVEAPAAYWRLHPPTPRNATLAYYQLAGKGLEYVKVPRVWHHYWPDLGFADLLLLGFYRFKCGETQDEQRACRMSFREIVDVLGFSVITWRRAAQTLEKHGLISREHENGAINVVRLPDSIGCTDANPALFEPHPALFEPVVA